MGWPKMTSDEYKPRMIEIAETQQQTIKMMSERVSLISDTLKQMQARIEAIYAERIERGESEIAVARRGESDAARVSRLYGGA